MPNYEKCILTIKWIKKYETTSVFELQIHSLQKIRERKNESKNDEPDNKEHRGKQCQLTPSIGSDR